MSSYINFDWYAKQVENFSSAYGFSSVAIQDMTTTDPATLTPNEGQSWIVASGAIGAWAGQATNRAVWSSGSWVFYPPTIGYLIWDLGTSGQYCWNGVNWEASNFPLMGDVFRDVLTVPSDLSVNIDSSYSHFCNDICIKSQNEIMVWNMDTLDPAGLPAEIYFMYFVVPPVGASGVWATHPNEIAYHSFSVPYWTFSVPSPGQYIWNLDTGSQFVWNGAAWVASSAVLGDPEFRFSYAPSSEYRQKNGVGAFNRSVAKYVNQDNFYFRSSPIAIPYLNTIYLSSVYADEDLGSPLAPLDNYGEEWNFGLRLSVPDGWFILHWFLDSLGGPTTPRAVAGLPKSLPGNAWLRKVSYSHEGGNRNSRNLLLMHGANGTAVDKLKCIAKISYMDPTKIYFDFNATGFPTGITPIGGTVIDNVTKKFGIGAMYCDGGMLGGANITDADFILDLLHLKENGDYCVDCWIKFENDTLRPQVIFSCYNTANDYFEISITTGDIGITGTTVNLNITVGGSALVAQSYLTAIAFDYTQWHHYVWNKEGLDYKLYIDGVWCMTATAVSTDMPNFGSATPHIGSRNGAGNVLYGWIDEFRFSMGSPIWTSNFTPPTWSYEFGRVNGSFDLPGGGVLLNQNDVLSLMDPSKPADGVLNSVEATLWFEREVI